MGGAASTPVDVIPRRPIAIPYGSGTRRRNRVRGDGRRDEVVRGRRRTFCSLAAQARNLPNRCSSPAHAAARMRRIASARGNGIVVTSRFSASLATRCRLLLVMLASPCRTSELLARARAASGRGAVPGRRRADVADVDTVDARCPRPRRRPPRLRGATGPRRAASRARLGCPSRLWRQLRGSRLRSSHGAASGQCQETVGARQSVEGCPLAAVHRE